MAARVAAELRRDFGVAARLVSDKSTRLDVRLDGKTVFSATRCGHLPKAGEVTARIRELDKGGHR